MPLVRYFLFTGAVLLGLLFGADRYFPEPAGQSDKAVADLDRSIMRIHTSHRWPDAVSFDTNAPMPHIVPPTVVAVEAPLPARVREANAQVPPAPPKLASKHRRRTRMVARLPAPPVERRQLAYQTDWASAAR
jgi:hypothetical protein